MGQFILETRKELLGQSYPSDEGSFKSSLKENCSDEGKLSDSTWSHLCPAHPNTMKAERLKRTDS
jgi:hypothetical protein